MAHEQSEPDARRGAARAAPARTPAPMPRRISFSILLLLRWGAILGQGAVIVVVHFGLGVALPLGALAAMIALESCTNLALHALGRRYGSGVPPSWLALVMGLDVALLTVMLWLTGGPANPFAILYLLHIAMASVTLSERAAWWVVAGALASHGVLYVLPDPGGAEAVRDGVLSYHIFGVWAALAVTGGFTVYFVGQIRRELARRDRQLERVVEMSRRQERLASLATLSAGAAHELATPLSTIALVAKELERALARTGGAPPDWVEDARLIRAEVSRCQRILEQMAVDTGASRGELPVAIAPGDLLREAIDELGRPEGVTILDEAGPEARGVLTPRATSFAIQGIVRNALDAAAARDRAPVVRAIARADSDAIEIRVEDESGGMPDAIADRAIEPFFTTKGTGQGMGLGLFLASNLAERLGGALELETEWGRGSAVTFRVPRAGAETDHNRSTR